MKQKKNKKIYRKRRKKESFFYTGKFSIILLVFIVILGGVFKLKNSIASVFKTEIFTVKNIKIYNNRYLTDGSIMKICQMVNDEKILDVDLNKLRKTILKHEFIKDVTLRKNYPSTLEIYIEEKRPFAYVMDDILKTIDENGSVLPDLEFKKVYDIPIISGLKEGPDFDMRKNKAIQILKSTKTRELNLFCYISELNFNEKYKITLYLCEDGIPVYMGHKRIDAKLLDLKYFLNYLRENNKLENIEYIDLRFNGQIIIKETPKT